jgi:hypothetical protein
MKVLMSENRWLLRYENALGCEYAVRHLHTKEEYNLHRSIPLRERRGETIEGMCPLCGGHPPQDLMKAGKVLGLRVPMVWWAPDWAKP